MSYWVIPVGVSCVEARSRAATFASRTDAEQFAVEKNVDEVLELIKQFRERFVHYQMNESERFDYARHIQNTDPNALKWQVFDSIQEVMQAYSNFFEG